MEAINKRKFKREELINVEEINTQILLKSLRSEHEGTVIYSLDLLEEINHPQLKSELITLLGHASSKVRVSVLERIEDLSQHRRAKRCRSRFKRKSPKHAARQCKPFPR